MGDSRQFTFAKIEITERKNIEIESCDGGAVGTGWNKKRGNRRMLQ